MALGNFNPTVASERERPPVETSCSWSLIAPAPASVLARLP